MTHEEFIDLPNEYLDPLADPNPGMAKVQIVWERDNPSFGSLHISLEHGITEREVEHILLEIPPYVEAKHHPTVPHRTLFWGATRLDRYLVVVCEDWNNGDISYLRPITAFEPEEGRAYWDKQT